MLARRLPRSPCAPCRLRRSRLKKNCGGFTRAFIPGNSCDGRCNELRNTRQGLMQPGGKSSSRYWRTDFHRSPTADQYPVASFVPEFRELLGTHLDIAEDASQRADLKRLVSMHGYGRALVSASHEVMASPYSHQRETLLPKKTDHLFAGGTWQIRHGQVPQDPSRRSAA